MTLTPYYEKDGITIYCGDCIDILSQLESGFDLAIADPPYFRIIKEDWDRQFKKLKDYIAWLERVVVDVKRVLSAKGSLYVFADDKTAAYVQVMIDQHLTLLNSLIWHKTNNQSVKAAHKLRSFAPMTERILFYTPQLCPTGLETVKLDLNNFVSLRKYFEDYQKSIGLSGKEINLKLGHQKADHCFRWNSTQWDLPTKEVYTELGQKFNVHGFVRREYEALRREYEALRRVFNATSDTFDVISGPIISQSENSAHPTTKPLWLMTRLIETSTNQGCQILDPCCGSGTVLWAAQNMGRRATGIEINEAYCKIAVERLKQPSFFSIPNRAEAPAAQLSFELGENQESI